MYLVEYPLSGPLHVHLVNDPNGVGFEVPYSAVNLLHQPCQDPPERLVELAFHERIETQREGVPPKELVVLHPHTRALETGEVEGPPSRVARLVNLPLPGDVPHPLVDSFNGAPVHDHAHGYVNQIHRVGSILHHPEPAFLPLHLEVVGRNHGLLRHLPRRRGDAEHPLHVRRDRFVFPVANGQSGIELAQQGLPLPQAQGTVGRLAADQDVLLCHFVRCHLSGVLVHPRLEEVPLPVGEVGVPLPEFFPVNGVALCDEGLVIRIGIGRQFVEVLVCVIDL